jgi:serine/threonine-protein kinase RsbW
MARLMLAVPRHASSVEHLRQTLDGLLGRLQVTAGCRGELALLMTEAMANAVCHGRGDAPVEVTIDLDEQRCLLEIGNCDGQLDESRFHAMPPVADQEHGRGMPLIGALADEVCVLRPRRAWVLVRIVKRLEREPVSGRSAEGPK